MKLLHTADWHAGRVLHGQSRTPEVQEALREIAELACYEAVDLVLVAGDLYDSKHPTPDAEAAVYEFFATLARAGIPSVAIAGNHDSPVRLDAAGRLLGLAGVRVFGHARVAHQGGVFELCVGDERARIAALPFVSERRIVKVIELLEEDPGRWRERYRQGMRKLIQNLTAEFHTDAVNLLLLHGTMNGATLANSEYQFHCTEDYSLGADIFPEACSYVALGHIHKPQGVQGMPEEAARYAGSPLQLDFGEAGDTKYVYLVETRAGAPTRILDAHPLSSGRRLKAVHCQRDELDRRLDELEFDGWLKLSVALERPEPGLKDRLKRDYPNLLVVEQRLPERAIEGGSGIDHTRVELTEAFHQFYRDTRGEDLPAPLAEAFGELYRATDPLADEVGAAEGVA
jgi:exonuclease SbcD